MFKLIKVTTNEKKEIVRKDFIKSFKKRNLHLSNSFKRQSQKCNAFQYIEIV